MGHAWDKNPAQHPAAIPSGQAASKTGLAAAMAPSARMAPRAGTGMRAGAANEQSDQSQCVLGSDETQAKSVDDSTSSLDFSNKTKCRLSALNGKLSTN